MNFVRRLLILILVAAAASTESLAQCAMCRSTLENNLSNGQPGIGAGINFGILYLFFTPYLAVAVLAFLWYRTSRNGVRKFDQRALEG
jgi:hypothetical protein